MLTADADLVDPAAVAGEMPWLAGEVTKIALGDMARGGMSSKADRKQFVVGQNLACAPGAVVYREEMPRPGYLESVKERPGRLVRRLDQRAGMPEVQRRDPYRLGPCR